MKAILTGFMGSGKTTVSKILGEKLKLEVRDLDQVIVDSENTTIPEIFHSKGEAYFRRLEFTMLARQGNFAGVLATGGGTIINDDCAQLVKDFASPVILLDIFDKTIHERLNTGTSERPIASSKTIDELIELKHQRDQRYHEVADLIVQTDGKIPSEIADEIILFLNKK